MCAEEGGLEDSPQEGGGPGERADLDVGVGLVEEVGCGSGFGSCDAFVCVCLFGIVSGVVIRYRERERKKKATRL